jgi:hypothetical protein
VGVKGKAILNTLSLHYAKTHPIDKTEWMVSILVKKLEGLLFDLIRGEILFYPGTLAQNIQETPGLLITFRSPKKGIGLANYMIGGQEDLVGIEKARKYFLCFVMVGIVCYLNSIPGACIYEDFVSCHPFFSFWERNSSW